MRKVNRSTVNPVTRLQFLVERHQELDDEADELQTREYLSPFDKDRLKLVKVMRLKAKEAVEKTKEDLSKHKVSLAKAKKLKPLKCDDATGGTGAATGAAPAPKAAATAASGATGAAKPAKKKKAAAATGPAEEQ